MLDPAQKPNKLVFLGKIVGGVAATLLAAGLVAWILLSGDDERDATPIARVSKAEASERRARPDRDEEPPPVVRTVPESRLDPAPEPKHGHKAKKKSPRRDPATTTTTTTQPKVTPTPAVNKGRPSKELKIGFARAAKTAKQCGERHGALSGQRITVQATINKAGTVISANATGSNRSTPLGTCVAKAVKTKARFIKWGQPLQTANYTVKL